MITGDALTGEGAVVRIPDELATRLAAEGGDLERRAVEALALQEFRAGRLTKASLPRILGFQVLDEVDGFLKTHNVYEPYNLDDLEREVQRLDHLGL